MAIAFTVRLNLTDIIGGHLITYVFTNIYLHFYVNASSYIGIQNNSKRASCKSGANFV